ncbi:MAG: NUDIX domain-containing protein [Candidatus Zambryskibacteria bacterium]|nr:NUDIX domain-containing protein [Candidatus Zambryskibacteria bacterium]
MYRWFAGAVVWKREEGKIYLLVQDSKSMDQRYICKPLQTKFPGGTNRGHKEDSSASETLIRELEEETNLRLRLGVRPRILRVIGRQVFFLVSIDDCVGILRREQILDGDDTLSPPYWVKADELGRVLYKTHQYALHRTLQYFNLVG